MRRSGERSSTKTERDHRDYVYIKRITSLEIEVEKLRRRLKFASGTISSAQHELVAFQKQQDADTRKLQRTLTLVRGKYDELRRNVILSRVRKVLLRVSFGSWKDQWERDRVPRVTYTSEQYEEIEASLSTCKRALARERIKSILRDAESKIQASRTQTMRTYLRRWRYGSEKEKAASRAARIMTATLHRGMRRAMARWHRFTRSKRIVFRVARRLERAPLCAAWNTWKKRAIERGAIRRKEERDGLRADRDALAAELVRARRAMSMGRKLWVLSKLSCGVLIRPFNKWKYETREAHREREEIGIALSRLVRLSRSSEKANLRQSFWMWRDYAHEARAKDDDAHRSSKTMARIVRRMQHRALHKAMSRWADHRRGSRERDLRRQLRQTGLRCALLAMDRARSKLAALEMSRAWRRWSDAVWRARTVELHRQVAESSVAHATRAANRLVRRWQHRDVANAFVKWVARCTHERRRERVAFRVLCRWIASKKASALQKWRAVTEEGRHAESVMSNFVKRMTHAKTNSAFGTWKHFVISSNEHDQGLDLIRRVVAKLCRRKLARGFVTWSRFASRSFSHDLARKHERALARSRVRQGSIAMERCTKRILLNQQARAFRKWKESFEKWNVEDRERVFNHQLAVLEEQLRMQRNHQALRIVERSLRHWHRQQLASAFNQLRLVCEEEGTKRAMMIRLFAKWQRRGLSKGFMTWRDGVRGERGRRDTIQKMIRVVQSCTRDKLARAFRKWTSETSNARHRSSQQRRAASTINRVVRHWKRKTMSSAFDKWTSAIENTKALTRLMNRVVRRLLHVKCASAFDWLRECAEIAKRRERQEEILSLENQIRTAEKREHMHVMLRVISGCSKRSLSAAFRSWLDAVHVEKHLFQRRHESVMRVERILRKIVWSSRSRAWNKWKASHHKAIVQSERRTRAIREIHRAVEHWRYRSIARGMETWKSVLRDEDRFHAAKRRVAWVISHAVKRNLVPAWNKWTTYCIRAKQVDSDQGLKRYRAVSTINRVVRHWKRAQMGRSFAKWTTAANNTMRVRRLMDRILRRFLHAKCAAAIDWWCNLVAIEKERERHSELSVLRDEIERVKRRERMQVIVRVVDGWIRRGLSRGFRAWETNTIHAQRQLFARRRGAALQIEHVLRRAASKSLSRGWNAWRDHLLDRDRKSRAANRVFVALTRMMHQKRSRAWNAWRDIVRELARRDHDMHARRARATQTIAFAVRRWRQKNLARGFETWYAEVRAGQRIKRLLRTILMRMNRLHIAAGMSKWKETCRHDVRVRVLLGRVFARWRNRLLLSGFGAWERAANRRAVEQTSRSRALKTFGHVVGRWRHRITMRGFASWLSWTRQAKSNDMMRQIQAARQRDSMRLLSRVLDGWVRKSVQIGFRTWQDRVQMRKHILSSRRSALIIVDRVLHHMLHVTMSRGWNRWTSFVDTCRVDDEKRRWGRVRLRRALWQCRRSNLMRAWRTWHRRTKFEREGDLLRLRRRRVLHVLMSRKHMTRTAMLRMSFLRWKSQYQIDATTGYYRERFSRLREELCLLQINGGAARMRVVIERIQHRALISSFQKWRLDTVGDRLCRLRKSDLLSRLVLRSDRSTKRFAFDRIRRMAILQYRARLDRLEHFLSNERAARLRHGMRTFITVMMKTVQNKERLRLLRAFNRIFQYGMKKLHDRISFMRQKHADVVSFVRRLREEIVDDEEEETWEELESSTSVGSVRRTRRVDTKWNSPRTTRDGPRTPPSIDRRRSSPIVRRRQYHSHHEPSPPPLPLSERRRQSHVSAARRILRTGRFAINRWLLKTAFMTWSQSISTKATQSWRESPPSPPSTTSYSLRTLTRPERPVRRHRRRVNVDDDAHENSSYDFERQFSDWKTAAMRIRERERGE